MFCAPLVFRIFNETWSQFGVKVPNHTGQLSLPSLWCR